MPPVKKMKLPHISTCRQLWALIDEIGFLPLFENSLPGFSVRELTDANAWWNESAPELDPWEWRKSIAAEGQIAYGKFFRGNAGYISRGWFPIFANFRRDGYDFDALWEEGKAKRREKLIMDLFPGAEILPSYEIRQRAGFGGDGEKGFESALTGLMGQTYLLLRGFERRKSKSGEYYGWPVGLCGTPEALFGAEHVRCEYRESPERSLQRAAAQCAQYIPTVSEADIFRFLK